MQIHGEVNALTTYLYIEALFSGLENECLSLIYKSPNILKKQSIQTITILTVT